jgi:hypothetical protein
MDYSSLARIADLDGHIEVHLQRGRLTKSVPNTDRQLAGRSAVDSCSHFRARQGDLIARTPAKLVEARGMVASFERTSR